MKFIKRMYWKIEILWLELFDWLKSGDKFQLIKSKFIKCKNCVHVLEPNNSGKSICFRCIESNYRLYKKDR